MVYPRDVINMGSQLGPILAYIFMATLEPDQLKQSGSEFVCYLLYMDVSFCVTEAATDVKSIMEAFNNADFAIMFAIEKECEHSLSFLDVFLKRLNDGFVQPLVYRKYMYAGQYKIFLISIPLRHKCNLV